MTKKLQITGALLLFGLVTSAQAVLVTEDASVPGFQTTLGNGVIISYSAIQPTGTGVIDPFLRVQADTTESGINSSFNVLDDKPGPWTHELSISSLAAQTINGTAYYKFLLDANQQQDAPITVDTVRFYTGALVGSQPAMDAFTATVVGGGTPSGYTFFDALASGTTDYDVTVASGHGSGSGDLFMYVPVSDIGTSGYLYMYDVNGNPGTYASNDGFEEWSALTGPAVPDASTSLTLLGMALVGIEGLRRKLRA